MPTLYLASGSPRRRELLDQIGVRYEVINVNVPEHPLAGESPDEYVSRLALAKAKAGVAPGWQLAGKTATIVVLGADTAVVVDGEILGKPDNPAKAGEMLRLLSGRYHDVLTSVALVRKAENENPWQCLSRSRVRFRSLSESDIQRYLLTGEGLDKAGAYAVQGRAAIFIEYLEGSYSGVMGLPVYETAELLVQAGIDVLPATET